MTTSKFEKVLDNLLSKKLWVLIGTLMGVDQSQIDPEWNIALVIAYIVVQGISDAVEKWKAAEVVKSVKEGEVL